MGKFKYILFFAIFSTSAFAACQKHQQKVDKYTGHLSELEQRHCFFPETGTRKPCLETEIGQEVKIRKLASLALYAACDQANPLK